MFLVATRLLSDIILNLLTRRCVVVVWRNPHHWDLTMGQVALEIMKCGIAEK